MMKLNRDHSILLIRRLIFKNHLYISFLMDYLFAKPLSSTNFLPHFGKNIANALNLC